MSRIIESDQDAIGEITVSYEIELFFQAAVHSKVSFQDPFFHGQLLTLTLQASGYIAH